MWRVREWLAFLWPPHWWYSWIRAAHALDNGCAWCTPGTRCTCRPEPELVYVDPYGSMIWAEERALMEGMPSLAGEYADRFEDLQAEYERIARRPLPDWREQTAADLAPEALDSDVQPDPYLDAIAAEYGSEYDPYDSGPGVLSLVPPGPDPDALGAREPPVRRIPTPERLCGPEQPHEKPAGTESAGSGLTRLADSGELHDAALLADVSRFMRDQDADVARWLAARAVQWAAMAGAAA